MNRAQLLSCCGSSAWVDAMLAARPTDPVTTGREIWWALAPGDWREAFAAHPRIGERPRADSQEAREQSSMDGADSDVRELIARGNQAYEARFGMTYVVRAAGRRPDELLALLTGRLDNDPDEELRVAAAQQWEITERRLRALVPA